jgi:hypothetical protein
VPGALVTGDISQVVLVGRARPFFYDRCRTPLSDFRHMSGLWLPLGPRPACLAEVRAAAVGDARLTI